MRIALVTTSWPAEAGDPAGHFVRAEARELAREGHQIAVMAPAPGGAFGWPGVMARVRERPPRAWGAARWVLDARTCTRALDVDRVVAHWALPCAWPIGIAAEDAELDVVSHGSDVRLLVSLPRALRRYIVAAVASRARSWRFVSEDLRACLCASLGAATARRVDRIAEVRPAAIDPPDGALAGEAGAAKRRALGAARVAVTVGRLVASKRVDLAIEHVARSRAFDALVVVGDGPERARLERLARQKRVDARFVGLVTRGEALAWIAAADAVIHASSAEGASTVLREADALGTPVVLLG
jgi:glycosyltransferase involved in cell wall biosynthesis